MSSPAFQFTLPHGERRKSSRPPGPLAAFQFTLPHGERHGPRSPEAFFYAFQFTLPHGERPPPAPGGTAPAKFQFTLPHGERPEGRDGGEADWGVSIHAPAWGATVRSGRLAPTSHQFQFTLPHGERPCPVGWVMAALEFQFAMWMVDLVGTEMGYDVVRNGEGAMMTGCRRVLWRGLGRKRKVEEGAKCKCFRQNVSVCANGRRKRKGFTFSPPVIATISVLAWFVTVLARFRMDWRGSRRVGAVAIQGRLGGG